jgi:hypothetical protein
MDEQDLRKIRVMVKSLSTGVVTYSLDTRHVRREWTRLGQVIPIPADELQEALYDQGTYNLFALGFLGIDNSAQRKLVGLEYEGMGPTIEPFDADKATKLLTQEQDLNVFRNKLQNLKLGNIEILIAVACDLKNIDYNKQKIIKEVLGIDIATLIKNSEEDNKQ